MGPRRQHISAKVDWIRKNHPVYAEMAEWMGRLLSKTIDASDHFQMPMLDLNQQALRESWLQGKHLINLNELPMDYLEAETLFKKLVKLVATRDAGSRQAEGLLRAWQNDHEVLINAVWTYDLKVLEKKAQQLGLDMALLILIVRLSIRPTIQKIANFALEQLDLSQWSYGHCPVCGSAPKLAELIRETGRRRLYCTLCETAWIYPRHGCPFCETRTPEDLVYLQAENDESRRVDLCNGCGAYIKTIDSRGQETPLIVLLDDIATWHLDLIVQRYFENIES